MRALSSYSTFEEILNAVTHGIGALLSVAGLTLLVYHAILDQNVLKIISFSIYGASLVILFLASTLYHAITHDRAKTLLKLTDHCAIYLLIAGTYTPLLLVTLNGFLGISMLILIWLIAALGIAFKIKYGSQYKLLSVATYLGMGGIALTIMTPLKQQLTQAGFSLLATGGAIYALGVIFYLMKKTPYTHAIWHLFVIGGAACHFAVIFNYV